MHKTGFPLLYCAEHNSCGVRIASLHTAHTILQLVIWSNSYTENPSAITSSASWRSPVNEQVDRKIGGGHWPCPRKNCKLLAISHTTTALNYCCSTRTIAGTIAETAKSARRAPWTWWCTAWTELWRPSLGPAWARPSCERLWPWRCSMLRGWLPSL